MNSQDIRWLQRLDNYNRALAQLENAVRLMGERPLSDLEKQGVIQAFEFTYELAWNTLRDFLVWQGIPGLTGSRDTIREAFSRDLIADGEAWMDMLLDRNRTSHTYNHKVAEAIVEAIQQTYCPCLVRLRETLEEKRSQLG